MREWFASILKNDITERAIKTFVQGYLAGWAVTGFQVDKGALIGASAAGLSAVWNYIKTLTW